jgi:predicted trehalose synthase
MLRSIDYVAQVAHPQRGLNDPTSWAKAAADAFLSSYGAISGADIGLLQAFQIEKACYEVRYEANNRPGWEWIPLGALERLAQ